VSSRTARGTQRNPVSKKTKPKNPPPPKKKKKPNQPNKNKHTFSRERTLNSFWVTGELPHNEASIRRY
jgi:hypothetical protein